MFTLELDFIIVYVPPMDEHGRGIHLTRELQLPFAPFDGLQVTSRKLDIAPGPEGFVLKDVIWDADREVFLAHSTLISHDLPMEDIPADLNAWMELGWRLGSYADKYEVSDEDEDEDVESEPESGVKTDGAFPIDDEFEAALARSTLPPRKRSKQLNLVMRALVRTMVEQYNNLDVAYAMDKTKRHFSKQQLEKNDSAAAKQWHDAIREYLNMSWEQQIAWQKRVERTHPRLDKLVEQL